MATRIKGLLFDKDGTLFDFHKTWGVWCGEVIDAMAADDADVADRLATVLMFDRSENRFLKESPVIAGTLGELADMVQTVFPDRDHGALYEELKTSATGVEMVPAVPLVPLMEAFLSRDLKLGIATNDAESAARAHLDRAGIETQFHFIAGYDSGFGGKPEPGMLLAFADQMGLDPAEVAMVGDTTHDLHAGLAAGMVRVAVLTGMADHADLAPHADIVLKDIGEIPAWLEAG